MANPMMRRTAFLLLLSALAGCAASPEQKVRAALVDAGVSDRVAGCMAKPMARKLSVDQLMALKRLAKQARADAGAAMTPKHMLRKIAALGDPEIAAVTGRAALTCFIGG